MEGVLAENNKLDNAEAIIDGGVFGPESVAVLEDGSVLTGVGGGDIIKYKDGKVSVIAKTGASCGKCCHRLSMKYSKKKHFKH